MAENIDLIKEANRSLLIVDDEKNIINAIRRELKNDNYIFHATTDPEEALAVVRDEDVGVVLSDQRMPQMDGVTFLEKVKALKPDSVRIIITGYSTKQNAIDAINRSGIFSYLTKPWQSSELKAMIARAFEHFNLVSENKRLQILTQTQNNALKNINEHLESLVEKRTKQLTDATQEGIWMLATASEAKDDITGNHIRRIASLTESICRGLQLSPSETEDIGFFSMMHDIGKIHIPDRILQNTGKLSPEDWRIMQTHTIMGEKILGQSAFYKLARVIARSHHERWDGAGYPDGLAGENIPLPARIVSIADVYDALTHERPYKPAWPHDEAIAEMAAASGKAFDPAVLKIFLNIQSTPVIEESNLGDRS